MRWRLIWFVSAAILAPVVLAAQEVEKAKPPATSKALAVEAANSAGRVITLDILVADLGEKLASPTAAAILERDKAGKLAGKMAVRLSALENQMARLQFGETVARATGRTVVRPEGGFRGGGLASYSDVQVGTVVQAIARSEDDGSIVADLKIERSGLAASGRNVAAGGADSPEQPPQSVGQLSLATTVRLKPGEPTIIGGRDLANGGETSQTWIVATAQFAGDKAAAAANDRAAAPSAGPVNEVRVFALKHASAADLTGVLVNVFAGQPLRIAAEPRTNSILVVGPAAHLQTAHALLTRLDEGK